MDNRARIEQYLDRLLGYAMSLSRHRDEARDLVQECALQVLKAKKIPGDEPAYRAWIFRILRNLFLERLRRENRRTSIVQLLVEESQVTSVEKVKEDSALMDRIMVERAMQCLSADHHEVVALVDIAGFTYAEAAELLDVPVGTVMSRISRARSALLKQLTVTPEPRQSQGRRVADRSVQ